MLESVEPDEVDAVREGWIDLGPATSYPRLPARISVGRTPYYLVFSNGDYQLLSAVCPHQGGTVHSTGTGFECPSHGWRYDDEGGCINAPGERLASVPVSVQGGHLFGHFPQHASTPALTSQRETQIVDCTIQLHAHACLEITYNGFSLLTDPWLAGPAFLGSWIQYPPSSVEVSDLRPNAILITHEHSDHFHEPTLKLFDRSIPIYVPDFPNRRMVNQLHDMGFSTIHPMAFGEIYRVSDDIKLTCFEPGGMWNDSIVLIDIAGFRFLNINDAGLNQRIAAQVAPVDVVASGFSSAASGYPLTWGHLSEAKKIEIMEQARSGKLGQLREAMDLYGGKYLLPFAGHFALWHPSHLEYARLMRKNIVDDVVEAFGQSEVRVIDLLPGECWDVSSGDVSRVWDRRDRLYDRASLLGYMDRNFDARIFKEHHPDSASPSPAETEAYFLRLNQVPDIAFCEDLTVAVRVQAKESDGDGMVLSFVVKGGSLAILEDPPLSPNLVIEIPGGVLKRIMTENLSWDEAHIGFWCRITRSPDIYHPGFWRLLQAPYFNKPINQSHLEQRSITGNQAVADLIEKYGSQADRVLRRYGLYCAGCHHSTSCSVSESGLVHGIPETRMARLLLELNLLFD